MNPLPRTPLKVVDVRTTGACVGVSFAIASSTQVTASWAADAPGATCTAASRLKSGSSASMRPNMAMSTAPSAWRSTSFFSSVS